MEGSFVLFRGQLVVFRSESLQNPFELHGPVEVCLFLVELTVSTHFPFIKNVVAGDKLDLPKVFSFEFL